MFDCICSGHVGQPAAHTARPHVALVRRVASTSAPSSTAGTTAATPSSGPRPPTRSSPKPTGRRLPTRPTSCRRTIRSCLPRVSTERGNRGRRRVAARSREWITTVVGTPEDQRPRSARARDRARANPRPGSSGGRWAHGLRALSPLRAVVLDPFAPGGPGAGTREEGAAVAQLPEGVRPDAAGVAAQESGRLGRGEFHSRVLVTPVVARDACASMCPTLVLVGPRTVEQVHD